MIDLYEEMERMQKMLDRRERMALGVTCTEMIELITRFREAENDAARYRWLCQQAWFQVESEWQLSIRETKAEEEFIIGASEKIDQAMKERGDE